MVCFLSPIAQELASIISTLLAPSGGILIGAATQNEMVEMINNNVSSQTQPCYSMGGVGKRIIQQMHTCR